MVTCQSRGPVKGLILEIAVMSVFSSSPLPKSAFPKCRGDVTATAAGGEGNVPTALHCWCGEVRRQASSSRWSSRRHPHIVLRARPTAVRYRGTGGRLRRCCCTRVSRTSCSLRECQCATDCDVPAGGSPAHRVFGKMLDRRKIALDNPHDASEDCSAAVTRTQPATLSQSHSTSHTHSANNAQPVTLSQHRTEPTTLSQSH